MLIFVEILRKLKDALEQVDALQFWSTGVFTCYACRKSVKSDKFTSRGELMRGIRPKNRAIRESHYPNPFEHS